MDLHEWLPFRCWVCQGGEFDDAQEVTVPHKKAGEFSRASPTLQAPRPGGPDLEALRPSPQDDERQRLRELMKAFVTRGMAGVPCQLADEATGSLRRGMYRIDERLQYLTFILDDDGGEGSSFPSHAVHFAQVAEVARSTDAEAAFAQEVLQELDEEQLGRLIVLSYSVGQGDRRKVYILESSSEDRQSFVTCVRILKRYMDEQGGRTAQQIRC